MCFPLFGLVSNGNLDDAASANTWLLLPTLISFSNEENKDAFAVIQRTRKQKVKSLFLFLTLDNTCCEVSSSL